MTESKLEVRRVLTLVVTALAAVVLVGCPSAGAGGGTGNNDETAPAALSAVATSASGGQVTITWTDPPDADLDRVEITWTPSDGEAQPVTVAPGAESRTVTGLNSRKTYWFTLRAVDAAGNASVDVTVSSTTIATFSSGAGTEVTSTADGTDSFYVTDLDGDGDPDILSADDFDDRILWYENRLDIDGSFSGGTVIRDNADAASSVYATDLDRDGDADVLAKVRSFSGDYQIVWHENTLDDDGDFSAGTDITSSAQAPRSFYATDLDADGNADVLAAFEDGRIVWYENDGSGDFFPGTDITSGADGALRVYATDLDGDRDADVLGAFEDARIVWYENTDGAGTFSSGTDITSGAYVDAFGRVFTADLDGDGDADVLRGFREFPDGGIALYENDGSGGFSAASDIATVAEAGPEVYATTDLDGDGDTDVLSVWYTDINENRIVWYENTDRDGTLSAVTEIARMSLQDLGPTSVHATDLDGDGDADVLAFWDFYGDNRVVWYENRTVD